MTIQRRQTTSAPGSLAGVAQLLGDSTRIASDHYVSVLTDYREVDRTIALARRGEEIGERARVIEALVNDELRADMTLTLRAALG
jgi:hypothetical protein